MLFIKDSTAIAEAFKRIAILELSIEGLNTALDKRWAEIQTIRGKIATLEIENETLLREVDHWKAKAQHNKDERVVK